MVNEGIGYKICNRYKKMATDYLDAAVEKYPGKTGFVEAGGRMTYQDFRKNAYIIANDLIKHDVFKQPIAVYLDKSICCLYVFMGVIYSGNFYTPLDTDMPIERVGKICDVLHPSYIITDRKYGGELKGLGIEQIIIDEISDQDAVGTGIEEVRKKVIDTDLAYVLFTSGSTGVPKGVAVSHRSIITYMEWSAEAFHFNCSTVFGNQTPFYFSMSVLDIFQTLKSAATLVMIPKKLFSFPAQLLRYIDEHDINTIYWVPSALCQVANLKALDEPKHIEKLHTVLFAGEVMPAKQLNMWRRALPGALFANLFGPTEVTDICSYYILNRPIGDSEPVPIGNACDNMSILILGEDGKEVERGVTGEMCVRGASLAYGYFNSPDKTKEMFVQNPLNMSYPETVYKTGDLVYVNDLDEIIYVSRKDFQIKHMGYRIELGEIENAVTSLDRVLRACCMYDKNNSRIALFYSGELEARDIRKGICNMIPKYMMPNDYYKMPELPLNLNGKIDRQKLKEYLENREGRNP